MQAKICIKMLIIYIPMIIVILQYNFFFNLSLINYLNRLNKHTYMYFFNNTVGERGPPKKVLQKEKKRVFAPHKVLNLNYFGNQVEKETKYIYIFFLWGERGDK